MQYLVMFLIALLITSIGFRKYIWFISIGYGFSVAAIGLAMIVFFRRYMSNLMLCICLLFFVYGVRLGGYLLIRELKLTTYNAAMKNEVKSDISLPAKFATWIFSALLYTLQVSPVLFRLSNGGTTDIVTLVGAVIMACGIILESAADVQKSMAKKKNPKRFVDTGLFRIVRCPNVYIMFGGARRLELRQNRNYGDDPEYQKYVKTVPIILPFIPLYSVADYTFLVG